ncbi:MAG TPA: serine hydrolase [Massilibacterium sp.]|nr:serine hydrolase [Massilibacterium sp.]
MIAMKKMNNNSLVVNLLRLSFKGILILLFVFSTVVSYGQQDDCFKIYYPEKTWEKINDLNSKGWSSQRLDEAQAFSNTLNTAAVVIVHKGKIVRKWGDTNRKISTHSIRKSFLSAMYGLEVQRGIIKLGATLKELNIGDNEPELTNGEKEATVRMLLKARSGVYHDAAYETDAMEAARPERYSQAPGTYWYYNNWDFNVLGTIYRQETGKDIYKSFKTMIADPIGMKSFNSETDGDYSKDPNQSIHPAYPFKMNAIDMARFGLLMERNGKWKEKQIIPEFWVKQSTVSYSDTDNGSYPDTSATAAAGGYGYLWWVAVGNQHFKDVDKVPFGLYTARGYRGHVIAVIPDMDLVFVYRNDDSKRGKSTSYSNIGKLLMKIINARQVD